MLSYSSCSGLSCTSPVLLRPAQECGAMVGAKEPIALGDWFIGRRMNFGVQLWNKLFSRVCLSPWECEVRRNKVYVGSISLDVIETLTVSTLFLPTPFSPFPFGSCQPLPLGTWSRARYLLLLRFLPGEDLSSSNIHPAWYLTHAPTASILLRKGTFS